MRSSLHVKGDPVPLGKKRVVFEFVMRGRVAALVDEKRIDSLFEDLPLTEDDLECEHGIVFDPSDYTDNVDEVEFEDATRRHEHDR